MADQLILEFKAKTDDLDRRLKGIEQSVAKTGATTQKVTSDMGNQFKNLGVQIASAFGVTMGISALVMAIKGAVTTAMNFEAQMSKVRAVTNATASDMDKLTTSAKALGSSTKFTATEVGQLQEEFGKLGFTTQEILDATEATLSLASAAGTTLPEAAMVAGSTLRGFGLDAKEAGRVTDVMALSFSKSALDIEDFRESMKLVAPLAKAANISLETSTAVLGRLSDAGLKGSIAGTAVKNLFSQLTSPTSDLAKELGFTVKNSQDLYRAFGILAKGNIDLAKATELTDERSKAAFLTMLNGVKQTEELDMALQGAAGSAKQMADIMEDNLLGDITQLTSAWEGLILAVSETEGLRTATQFLTDWLNTTKKILSSTTYLVKDAEEAQRQSAVRTAAAYLKKVEAITDEETKLADLTKTISYHTTGVEKQLAAIDKFTKGGTVAPIDDKGIKRMSEMNQQLIFHEIMLKAATDAVVALEQKRAELTESQKEQIKNVYYYTNAIKLLRDEIEKEGTSRERIAEILKLLPPLQAELAKLLGQETAAMKSAREEVEKLAKAEEDRWKMLEAQADDRLKKKFEVEEFISERTAQGLKEEMDAAIAAENIKAMAAEATAMQIGASEDTIKSIRQSSIDEQLRIEADYRAKIQEMEDAGVAATVEAEAKKQEARELADQQSVQAFQAYAQEIGSMINRISQAVYTASQYELQILDDKLANQQISQENFDRQRRRIMRKQAEDAKAFAIMTSIINTALAVTQALATLPPPASFIVAAVSAALGAVEVGIIAAEPIPRFAKGVIGLKGAGTETSDSINAKLSKGESVMTAKETREYMPVLTAIRKGTLEKLINETYVVPAVNAALFNGFADIGRSADLNGLTAKLSDHNIIRAMDRNREATVYGLKLIVEKMGKGRPPKRGYA